jgi:hypothetical protein
MKGTTQVGISSGNGQFIRGYQSNATFAPAGAIAEFIELVKLGITVANAFSFKYENSDLRFVSLQADQLNSKYTISLTDPSDNVYFSNTYEALVFDEAWLLVPQNHKVTITPVSNISRLRIIAQTVAILERIPLS